MYKPKIGDRVKWTGNRDTTGKPRDTAALGIIKRQHGNVKDAWEIKWDCDNCMYTYEDNLELAGPLVTTDSF